MKPTVEHVGSTKGDLGEGDGVGIFILCCIIYRIIKEYIKNGVFKIKKESHLNADFIRNLLCFT